MKVKETFERGEPLSETFIKEVEEVVGEKNVLRSEAHLIGYSLDYWMFGVFLSKDGVLPSLPELVVSPADTAEVQKVLELANRYGVTVTPFGGGSGVLGGAIPLKGSIILNLQRMNRFISLDEFSLTGEAEAGIIGANLERELNYRGYSMGNIPQSLFCSTLGGWVSTRAAGQFSTGYGKIEDMILGLEAVLPTGGIVNIKPQPRRSVGPSLMNLFLGGEGAFGIVTKAYFSVHPLPEYTAKQSFAFSSMGEALNAVRQVLRRGAIPACVRIFDTAETARYFGAPKESGTLKTLGKLLRREVITSVVQIASLSKAKEKIDNAELLKDKVSVIFISEGNRKITQVYESLISEICEGLNGIPLGEKPVDIWLNERFDVTLAPIIMQNGGIVDTIEVVSLFKDCGSLYRDVVDSMEKVKGAVSVSGHFSHFYREGACLYVTFAGFPSDKERFYREMWDRATEATLRNNGSISHHHGIGFFRAKYMGEELGDSGLEMLRDLRESIDPNHILNRGKLTEE